jgi:hypothetical protein
MREVETMVTTSKTVTPRGRSRSRARRLRFPCGHIEDEPAVLRRSHGTDRAVWVGCLQCNAIAIAFGDIDVRASESRRRVS